MRLEFADEVDIMSSSAGYWIKVVSSLESLGATPGRLDVSSPQRSGGARIVVVRFHLGLER